MVGVKHKLPPIALFDLKSGVSNHWNEIRTGLDWNGIEQYGLVKQRGKHPFPIVILYHRRLYYNVLQVASIIYLS